MDPYTKFTKKGCILLLKLKNECILLQTLQKGMYPATKITIRDGSSYKNYKKGMYPATKIKKGMYPATKIKKGMYPASKIKKRMYPATKITKRDVSCY